MKIKQGFILRKTAGRCIAVSMGEDYNGFKGLITLTGIAPFYWELLKEEQTEDSLVRTAVKKYDISEEQAREDLIPFLKKLSDAGILEG